MGRPKKEVDVRELVRRYKAGESCKAIGKAVGCSSQTVVNRLRGVIRLREQGSPLDLSQEDQATICQLYIGSTKITDIMDRVGLKSVAPIYTVLRKNNIPLQHSGFLKCPVELHRIWKLTKKHSLRQIEKMVDFTRPTIAAALKTKKQCHYHYERDTSGLVTKVFREYS